MTENVRGHNDLIRSLQDAYAKVNLYYETLDAMAKVLTHPELEELMYRSAKGGHPFSKDFQKLMADAKQLRIECGYSK